MTASEGMMLELMQRRNFVLIFSILMTGCLRSAGQDAKQMVQQAVQAELAADNADHTRWMYFEIDRKRKVTVKQWVVETGKGDLKRVLEESGRELSQDEQHSRIDGERDASAQAKQRKDNQHDDQEARQMLSMLPQGFVWTVAARKNGKTTLHFAPDPHFHAPSYQARVFAAMEGDMMVDDLQHRIESLKGRLTHNVKFGEGLLGNLEAGGSFDVERHDIGKGEWQIVETHVHITGRALLFKTISEQEDDLRSNFKQLPSGLSPDDAEKMVLNQGGPQSAQMRRP
jgi:hypothetical protein